MRSIQLRAVVPTDDLSLVFKQITDFARYPSVSADVRYVQTRPGPPQHTDWEVNFRRGIMRWTEREDIDPVRLRVDFEQVEGDFGEFRGSWRLAAVPAGCEVVFAVTYDFGIDSLAGIMDPLAERVIKRSICAVLADITGTVDVTEGGAALTDLGELPADSGIRIIKGEQ
jgi:ribosome-associated toxin RatA of RatAB toxin-antitoxin module